MIDAILLTIFTLLKIVLVLVPLILCVAYLTCLLYTSPSPRD